MSSITRLIAFGSSPAAYSSFTKGLSNAEIGQLFGISGVTVKKHLWRYSSA